MTSEKQLKTRSAISLRTILQSLLVAVVLPSAGIVAGMVNFEARKALSELAESQFRTVAQGATAKIHEHLGSVSRGLNEIEFLLNQHALSLSDENDIKAHLLTQAVSYPKGTLVGYGSAERRTYILARRGEFGATILHNGLSEIHRAHGGAGAPEDYRNSAWFKRGIEAKAPAWTKTYAFADGRAGVSAVLAHGGTETTPPVGVFHVDIPLSAMENWLGSLDIAGKGHIFIAHHDNTIAATPRIDGQANPAFEGLLKAGLATLNRGTHALDAGEIESAGFLHQDKNYHIAIIGAEAIRGLDWHVGVLVPEADILRLAIERMTGAVLFAGGAAIFVILLGAIFASRLSAPLRDVAHQLGEAARMRLSDTQASASMVQEVATLGEALSAMKSGLRSLERYVPREVARRLVTGGAAASIGVEERRLSIYVSDIEGFTGIAEAMEAGALVSELNAYFDDMTKAINECDGAIDKFMGDGILAMFNAPNDVPDHAAKACRAALMSLAITESAVAERTGTSRPAFHIRIGLAVGQVLVGNVGSSERFGYTVIGDTVNVAARLEGVNKAYGTRIIASDDLRDEAGGGLEWRRLDRVAVAGRRGGLGISELLGLSGQVDAARLEARDRYEVALDAYFAGDFAASAESFSHLAARHPEDKAAAVMAERARAMADNPPAADWDGVYVFRSK